MYGGLKWIIEDCQVINARSIGIDIGLGCDEWAGNKGTAVRTFFYNTSQYGQHIVRRCRFERCGQGGIAGVFSWKSQILDCYVSDTNYRNEFMSMETAGIKVHYNNDGLIAGNFMTGAVNSHGTWLDWGNQGIRFTQNVSVDNGNVLECEAMHGPVLIDNNVFIGSNFYQCDTRGIVIVHNLFANSNWLYSGTGRVCYVFQPHTCTVVSEQNSSPQYFQILNNIYIGCSVGDIPGINNNINYNCNNVGSNFTYTKTPTSMNISFNMDNSPFGTRPVISDSYIGLIPPANQGIEVTVDRDYFGNAMASSNPVAGPFANIKNGANNYIIWPRPGVALPTPYPYLPNAPTNLALNRPVTASSVSESNVASNAVDGGSTTRWSSAYSDPQWICVDLGTVKSMDRVVLKWEAAYAKAFSIQVSNDASTWTNVYSTTTGNGGVQDISFTATNARYVRMLGIQRGTTWGYSIWEFEVYGSSDGTPPPSVNNKALNRPVTVSSVADNCPGPNAVDGNTGTRWSSAYTNNEWIYVDLGSIRNLTGVKLNWETAYGRSYKIQVSNNAAGWTDVYSTTTGDGGIDEISFSASGRYLRMLGVQRATIYGYSLLEFEVYGN